MRDAGDRVGRHPRGMTGAAERDEHDGPGGRQLAEHLLQPCGLADEPGRVGRRRRGRVGARRERDDPLAGRRACRP